MKLKHILFLATITLGAFITATFSVGSMLSAPNPINIGAAPPMLTAKSVKIEDKTGQFLSGWLVTGDEAHGGILLMHGVRSNRSQMIDRAIFLNKAGYTVLLFDFQAHGESPGKHITLGFLEASNAEAAFTFLEKQLVVKKIGVIGVSLGGAAAILGNVSERANALVVESVYPTLQEAIHNRISMRLGALATYLTPLLMWQIEPRLGFNPDQLRPIDRMSLLKVPILIIAGTADKHTTLPESKRLYYAASQPKQFWAVEGASHEDYLRYSPIIYQDTILRFFAEYL